VFDVVRLASGPVLPLAAGLVVGAGTFGVLAIADGNDSAPRAASDRTDASTRDGGKAIFARMGCGSCHRLAAAGSSGVIGPNLDVRLAGHTAATLAERITRRAPGETFTTMPDDFGDRMTDGELDELVRFLLASRQ